MIFREIVIGSNVFLHVSFVISFCILEWGKFFYIK